MQVHAVNHMLPFSYLPATTRSGYGPQMANRIKELRQKRKLSAAQLGKRLRSGRSTITKLERGEMNLTTDWMQRIAVELGVTPEELISQMSSIPLELSVGAAFSEAAGRFELPAPPQRLQAPPGLSDPEEYLAAHVVDHSADRMYPPGSTLFVRRLEHYDGRLKRGAKIVVRHFVKTKAEGDTMEILVGVLDLATTGDLLLLTRSSDRKIPHAVAIRPAPSGGGLNERLRTPDFALASEIDYEPRSVDQAEILGVVRMAIVPE